jgi:energy-coupling factor transporter ATP-binding protein EcfA2
MLTVSNPPLLRELETDTLDADYDTEVTAPCIWDGLQIELRLFSSEESGRALLEEQTNLRWQPNDIDWLAFGWLMIAAEDAPTNQPLIELSSADYQGLVTQSLGRTDSLSTLVNIPPTSPVPQDQSGITSALVKSRFDTLKLISADGLGSDVIGRYFAEWACLLSQARKQFVPNGILDERLQLLLGLDVLHSPSESKALMLLSHPLRLRWFGAYLLEVSKVCVNALELQLRLNSTNDAYYLGRLEQLSPHGQPPLLANSARTLLIPVAEHGMAEVYAAIKQEGQVTSLWKSELDDAALTEIAKQVEQYLRAHPHKNDGISLVFTLPAGGDVPQKLLAMVRKGIWKNLPVRCHVLAPRYCWDEIIQSFQKLETESRMSGYERHGPPLQLELEEWLGELKASESLAKLHFDIAIVPNFFGDKVDVNEYADIPEQRAGSFSPLYDASSYVDRDAAAGSVSIVLKPDASDPVLEDWSTTNVRLLRSEAISPQSPDCTDYVKLRIRFEEAGALFAALHECSHWVVTLDRYIGRDQIESLPKRPDVLTVREGVGQSGLSTLVVSSDTGRKFVVQRLARKLKRISSSDDAINSWQLAEQVYDEIRSASPGLILKAMGLSRVTEEVLGLMVAKRIVERHHPANGMRSIWISLDEHSEWFGGDGGVRADLCRIDIFRIEGRLQLGALAVEGKLRKAYDAHGEQQASITAQLLREALEPESEAIEPAVDSAFWRRAILAAIEGAGGRIASSGSLIASDEHEEEEFREDLRNGEFDLAYCEAIYSICLYDRHAELPREEKNGVTIYRSSESEILSLINEGQPLTCSPTPNDAKEITASTSHGEISVGVADISETAVTQLLGTNNDIGLSENGATDSSVTEVLSGMSEAEKMEMYQLILDTLSEFQVQVRSPDDGNPPYVEGPAFIQFRVKPDRGVKPNKISEQESSLRLNLGLDEGKLLRFSIGGGTMNIDVPKTDEERYYVTAEELWKRWSNMSSECLRVPIGINQRGEVVDLDFSSPNSPHLLIGGATGSGKSEALNTILHGLTKFYTPDQLRLVLIDPKQTELLAFEKSPHLLGQIGFFDDDAVASLDQAVAEMQQRYGMFRSRNARSLSEYNKMVEVSNRLPWQVIVLDEYADLVSEPDVRKVIEASVKRLSQKARACGIHVIIATQKPSAENISTTVRSNLPAQLALRCRGATESRIVMDEAGAETLNGKGDAFFKIADRLERVQCALVT